MSTTETNDSPVTETSETITPINNDQFVTEDKFEKSTDNDVKDTLSESPVPINTNNNNHCDKEDNISEKSECANKGSNSKSPSILVNSGNSAKPKSSKRVSFERKISVEADEQVQKFVRGDVIIDKENPFRASNYDNEYDEVVFDYSPVAVNNVEESYQTESDISEYNTLGIPETFVVEKQFDVRREVVVEEKSITKPEDVNLRNDENNKVIPRLEEGVHGEQEIVVQRTKKPKPPIKPRTSSLTRSNKSSSELSPDAIEYLKNKYSPASFGYPKSILKTASDLELKERIEGKTVSKPPRKSLKIVAESKDGHENGEIVITSCKVDVDENNLKNSVNALRRVEDTLTASDLPEVDQINYSQNEKNNGNPVVNNEDSVVKIRVKQDLFSTTNINTTGNIGENNNCDTDRSLIISKMSDKPAKKRPSGLRKIFPSSLFKSSKIPTSNNDHKLVENSNQDKNWNKSNSDIKSNNKRISLEPTKISNSEKVIRDISAQEEARKLQDLKINSSTAKTEKSKSNLPGKSKKNKREPSMDLEERLNQIQHDLYLAQKVDDIIVKDNNDYRKDDYVRLRATGNIKGKIEFANVKVPIAQMESTSSSSSTLVSDNSENKVTKDTLTLQASNIPRNNIIDKRLNLQDCNSSGRNSAPIFNFENRIIETQIRARNVITPTKLTRSSIRSPDKGSPIIFQETKSDANRNNQSIVKPRAVIPINSERPLPNPYKHMDPSYNDNIPTRDIDNSSTNFIRHDKRAMSFNQHRKVSHDEFKQQPSKNRSAEEPIIAVGAEVKITKTPLIYGGPALRARSLSPQQRYKLDGSRKNSSILEQLPENEFGDSNVSPRKGEDIKVIQTPTKSVVYKEPIYQKGNQQFLSESQNNLESPTARSTPKQTQFLPNIPEKDVSNSPTTTKTRSQQKAQNIQQLEAFYWEQKAKDSSPITVQHVQTIGGSPKSSNAKLDSPSRPLQKLQNLQNVEAFCWKKLHETKMKKEEELYMNCLNEEIYKNVVNNSQQMYDPRLNIRSRSVSPGFNQNDRRSLSLPRRPEQLSEYGQVMNQQAQKMYGTVQQKPTTQALQYQNVNFVRNVPQRSTLSHLPQPKQGAYSQVDGKNPEMIPGSRSQSVLDEMITGQTYGVIKSYADSRASPTRSSNSPIIAQNTSAYNKSQAGPQIAPPKTYYNIQYNRHMQGSPSLQDPVYAPIFKRGSLVSNIDNLSPGSNKRVSFSNVQSDNNTEVWQRHVLSGSPSQQLKDPRLPIPVSVPTVPQRRVQVNEKVCDIYGKIHDSQVKSTAATSSTAPVLQYRPIQIQPNMIPSNVGVRNPQLQEFYNKQLRQQVKVPKSPTDSYSKRPLPPVPIRTTSAAKSQIPVNQSANKSDQRNVVSCESESGSEAGEVQRILQGMYQKQLEEDWADGKGRPPTGESGDAGRRGGRQGARSREDPRRHTLGGDMLYAQQQQQRSVDLEAPPVRGYAPLGLGAVGPLFDEDPGIMSEVETSSTGFRRGGKQRSSLPVVRTPSKTLERPLGLVFLQYRNETKRALLPNEITSIDTVRALFVRSFPRQLTMAYLEGPHVKIYIHDSSKDMFYELEDLRSHLRDIRDRSVLRLFESAEVSGGPIGPGGGIASVTPASWGEQDQSYFSEPEFDSEYQHQHIHKSKAGKGSAAPYYVGGSSTLPRAPLGLGGYAPDRKGLPPTGAPPKPVRAYGPPRTPFGGFPEGSRSNPRLSDQLYSLPDGYMSSPERGGPRSYEEPYYSQYGTRGGAVTPVIDEEASETSLLDEGYSLYGVKLPPGAPRGSRPPSTQPYEPRNNDELHRMRVEHMERQLANLTGLVQKALIQTPPTAAPRDFLTVPNQGGYRGDEGDAHSSSSSASLPEDPYHRSDKPPKLGKGSCHKSVSFEKSVSFSDEPPGVAPKQHSPQHSADSRPAKPAIKSSTLPRTSSQERDRLKPMPPPKPLGLTPPGAPSYRGDLALAPEVYNQLRGLQKKAKDLRTEVRALRRLSQAQAVAVREDIRDTFIRIRATLLAGGATYRQPDQEKVRLNREEELYKQEVLRLEKDLSDLEGSVESLRGEVINRRTRVNMSAVEDMALVLSRASKTVAELKMRFPGLQQGLRVALAGEMEQVVREEKFLKEEPERLESALRRCKKLTGTLVTLKRLASVQEQRLPGPLGEPPGESPPPTTPNSANQSKPLPGSRVVQDTPVGSLSVGLGSGATTERPENALDALLDELQTFARPCDTQSDTADDSSCSVPTTDNPSDDNKGHTNRVTTQLSQNLLYEDRREANAPDGTSEVRKGSMDSALPPAHNAAHSLSVNTGSLRRLHSYPSGSDTDNSPPIHPPARAAKPPVPERNAELLSQLTGRRVPPPPPPRTSSRSPLASPTSPHLPPRAPVQEGGTLRRNAPARSSLKDKCQTLPRNIGASPAVLTAAPINDCTLNALLPNSNSSSCESVNSQDGTKKSGNRQQQLEQRHQELLRKQKALQEQYARLQQIQRGSSALTVVPPAPDLLLKKTGSESNLLVKMNLNMAPAFSGSLTHLANSNNTVVTTATTGGGGGGIGGDISDGSTNSAATTTTISSSTTSKVYETDIL